MSESLRDLLLKSGLPAKLKVESKTPPPKANAPKRQAPDPKNKPLDKPTSLEPDLAQAYALRARQEKQERENAEREAAERAREKRERKEKLAALLRGKALNDANAELPRHFPHGNKIRRCYCTPDQLERVNRGDLGIVQFAGRYLLVERAIALQAQSILPVTLVLLCDPNSPADEDDIPVDVRM